MRTLIFVLTFLFLLNAFSGSSGGGVTSSKDFLKELHLERELMSEPLFMSEYTYDGFSEVMVDVPS